MLKRHATFSALRQRALKRRMPTPTRCNYADDYYGDRVCTRSGPAG